MSRLDETCAVVRRRAGLADDEAPRVGVVLGSGLGAFADTLDDTVAIPFSELPHFAPTTVVGHQGKLCVGTLGGHRIAVLQGRAHVYEGHDLDRVVYGVRTLARLGCPFVVLTNAAGGVRNTFQPGSLMLISDHLNLSGRNPLVGPNHDDLGPRFPDLTRAYDPWLNNEAREAAAATGVRLDEGVYAAMLGPSYETPAEIRMLRGLGADAVGMSTVPEVIALRHAGVRVAAISCITNLAAGMSAAPLSHDEVADTARKVETSFIALLREWIARIADHR
ncbi:MAG: purine-nucleoside phosphorylase [Myxococcota bacterium]